MKQIIKDILMIFFFVISPNLIIFASAQPPPPPPPRAIPIDAGLTILIITGISYGALDLIRNEKRNKIKDKLNKTKKYDV
jgi:hypothetical protein